MWLENPECKEVIRQSWSERYSVEPYKRLWPKLGGCKRKLKMWSKEWLGNNINEMRKAKYRLRELGQNQSNQATQTEEIILRSRIKDLWRREELYWKQRSGVKWLTKGDRNTTTFSLDNNLNKRFKWGEADERARYTSRDMRPFQLGI